MRVQTVTRRNRHSALPTSPPALLRNTTVLLYRNAPWAFAAFAVAVLVAFWPSYFSRLAQASFHAHAHGIAMSLWCGLLVAQASLVRSGNRPLHRRLGSLSYVLVPLVIATTLSFVHARMDGPRSLGTLDLYALSLMVNAVVAFGLIYALAIVYRRAPATHARYMLCTIFPLFTPVTDRIIGRHIPSLVPLVPRIDGAPIVPVAGFLLADAILVGLWAWDWRSGRRSTVFPVAFAILVLYQVSVMTLHQLPAWRAFGEWFLTLPLS